jgi:hypothetical protein
VDLRAGMQSDWPDVCFGRKKICEFDFRHPHQTRKQTEKTRKKISRTLLGRKLSKETKIKLSEVRRGFKCSEDTKKKISKARMGQVPWNKGLIKETDKRIAKMSEKFVGRKLSEETKMKLRVANLGEKSHFYIDGNGKEPYGKEFFLIKSEIRKRDDFMCQWPGCGKLENGKKHHVHHTDHNRHNNKDWNLITLCEKHHGLESSMGLDEAMGMCNDVLRARHILI